MGRKSCARPVIFCFKHKIIRKIAYYKPGLSLQCQRHMNSLNFFTRLSSLESKRYASKAFCMLRMDADYGHQNWVSYAHDLRVRYDIQQSDTRSDFKKKIINHFRSQVLHRLNEHITDKKMLNLYASFKANYKFESYLDYITNFTIRSTLAKTQTQCS